MSNLMELTQDDEKRLKEKEGDYVVKTVKIPNGALCKCIMFDIGFAPKVQAAADNVGRQPNLLDGYMVKSAVLGFYEEKKYIEVINTKSDPISFPQGESGFKIVTYLHPKGMQFAKPRLLAPTSAEEAKDIYILYLQNQLGITLDSTHPLTEGLEFHAFKYTDSYINKKTNKEEFKTYLDCYNQEKQERFEGLDQKYWSEPDIVKLIDAINGLNKNTKDSDLPF